jgi:LemA protein
MKKVLLAVLAGIVILGVSVAMWLMGTYNGLASQSQSVDTAFSDIQTQYQRRFDLIPNLVNAVQGAMKQEQDVFGAIAKARTQYAGAASNPNVTPGQLQSAAGSYDSAIGRLLVVMENYPTLKSEDSVQNLMTELSGTENRINVSRDRYNEQVREFNTELVTFPTNLVGGMFGFQKKDYFQADASAQTAPTVNLQP